MENANRRARRQVASINQQALLRALESTLNGLLKRRVALFHTKKTVRAVAVQDGMKIKVDGLRVPQNFPIFRVKDIMYYIESRDALRRKALARGYLIKVNGKNVTKNQNRPIPPGSRIRISWLRKAQKALR